MDKEKFIEWIKSLPEDVQIFKTDKNNYDCIDVQIFLEHKNEEFLQWYFGL